MIPANQPRPAPPPKPNQTTYLPFQVLRVVVNPTTLQDMCHSPTNKARAIPNFFAARLLPAFTLHLLAVYFVRFPSSSLHWNVVRGSANVSCDSVSPTVKSRARGGPPGDHDVGAKPRSTLAPKPYLLLYRTLASAADSRFHSVQLLRRKLLLYQEGFNCFADQRNGGRKCAGVAPHCRVKRLAGII